MIWISRMLHTVLPMLLVLAASPASSDAGSQTPIIDSTSSGLFTFSKEERAVRVAAVFVTKDSTVIPTLVRFLDQNGNVLKQVRGDLSEGNAVVAELTRDDVAGRGDLFVRVEVHHQLPGLRRERFPIMVSLQPIGADGSGGWLAAWPPGTCSNPGPGAGPPVNSGAYAMCIPPTLVAF
jgi:hypothetical protein